MSACDDAVRGGPAVTAWHRAGLADDLSLTWRVPARDLACTWPAVGTDAAGRLTMCVSGTVPVMRQFEGRLRRLLDDAVRCRIMHLCNICDVPAHWCSDPGPGGLKSDGDRPSPPAESPAGARRRAAVGRGPDRQTCIADPKPVTTQSGNRSCAIKHWLVTDRLIRMADRRI